jgi:hypothetical protein
MVEVAGAGTAAVVPGSYGGAVGVGVVAYIGGAEGVAVIAGIGIALAVLVTRGDIVVGDGSGPPRSIVSRG